VTREVALESDALQVTVIPELGGKIARLTSRATGREWLWRNPHLLYRRAAPGDSYVALHDTGGIDECFPEVHGEVFGRPWTVERGGAALAFSGAGYRLERSLRLDGASLELSYALENEGHRELPFVWCLHALFAIEPGMRIELPGGDEIVPGPERRFAEKRFVGSGRGEVGLRTADGREALRFRFDPREIPFVGLWQNYGRWSGAGTEPYFNLGIEPSIGDTDSLDEARTRGTAGVLAPGARRTWRVTLALVSL
jgi:hypothetical protein